MTNKIITRKFVGNEDGTSIYPLPISSSFHREITDSIRINESIYSDSTLRTSDDKQMPSKTSTFKISNQPHSFEAPFLNYMARYAAETRESIISQYENEIRTVIQRDDFIDGEISESEYYMIDIYNRGQIDYVADALMNIYSSSLNNVHILEGILTMISSVPYDTIAPKGQIMAMGLLINKTLSVRDKAIQCFEKWNSKKGLAYLKNIECSPSWLQQYVDKVIMYIERDGTE